MKEKDFDIAWNALKNHELLKDFYYDTNYAETTEKLFTSLKKMKEDLQKEKELNKEAKKDYISVFKGLDTNGDMEDEYMNDLKEKHKEFLAKKFKSDLKKDYIQKKKKTHFRITIDVQEVDDDEE